MKSTSLSAVIVAALVAILTLFSTLDFWRYTTVYNRRNPDPFRIGQQDARFRGAAAEIPEDAIVGYVSNLKFSDIRGQAAFFGAQYALAPRILVPVDSTHHQDIVLGNFSDQVDAGKISSEHHIKLEKDLGGGVVLFRKEEKQ